MKVIVIDDERAAREELKRLLMPYEDIEVVAEASDADQAKALIETLKPDLIFLDVQMPEKSGFDLLEALVEVPLVIFTTAHHQFAIQAFEVNALDYLLKPIRDERFSAAIERVKAMLGLQAKENKPHKSIFIKDGERRFLVPLHDIYRIESLENYSRLYFNGHKAMQRRSLRQWEDVLDTNIFFRINRTEIINTMFIYKIHNNSKGQLEVELKTGDLCLVSSRKSAEFKNKYCV